MHLETIGPADIERRSMEIIASELKRELPLENADIIKRVIHTSADFEYADTLYFSPGAGAALENALRSGADIVTDTQMARAGINKKALEQWGGQVHCFMSDPDVAEQAKTRGITRATVSMEKACSLQKPLIFAIGNAPTALCRLCELAQEGALKPAFVIGVPVGFVNVVESKELLIGTGLPQITARGRKGGSNVAAAICNAALYRLGRPE